MTVYRLKEYNCFISIYVLTYEETTEVEDAAVEIVGLKDQTL